VTVSQSQPGCAASPATASAEPSASVDFAIVNKFGVTIATADNEDTAKAACRGLLARFDGLTVVMVETTVKRTTIFRPRLRRVS
jgi:hypothetical protein